MWLTDFSFSVVMLTENFVHHSQIYDPISALLLTNSTDG